MRLTESNSRLQVALSVARRVDMPSKDVYVKTYSNCREQGLHIINYSQPVFKRRAVSVAENRNSDNIVVIFATQDDFDDHGILKSDKLWDTNRKFFAYKDFEGAAKFITKYLQKQVK